MNNLKHTPGPWSEKAIYSLLRFGDKHDGNWSDALYGIDEFMPFSEADARLIAAAPEMLELLIEYLKSDYESGVDHLTVENEELLARCSGLSIEEVIK